MLFRSDQEILRGLLVELEADGTPLDGLGVEVSEVAAALDPITADDVAWKQFDETIGNDAPKGKQMKCPHCGETFEA